MLFSVPETLYHKAILATIRDFLTLVGLPVVGEVGNTVGTLTDRPRLSKYSTLCHLDLNERVSPKSVEHLVDNWVAW